MSPQRQTASPHVNGEVQGPHPVGLLAEATSGPAVPIFDLVLVDQHAAQGWRVRQDERLDNLFEERCDWVSTYGAPGQFAVESDELSLTYDELDARANQLARYLRLHGAGAGDRIALLFDRPSDSYIAMLAVLKIGAAYVPLDVSFSADRMAYIVKDAQVRTVLSVSRIADRVERLEKLTTRDELVYLDLAAPLIDEQNSRRLIDAERGRLDNQLAYITYIFGADGQPRGVAVDHPSICNFVKVAAEVYGIQPRDRVYQGLTTAFDLSVEEIWVPWFRGATLVPKPSGASLQGKDLHRFLSERRVTAMYCVPSLLATLEADLPGLRLVVVSGEACPQDLIVRWHRPGRRLLNTYGPAEATVTATWTELHPDSPVTIGVPLPTYSTVILDVEDPYRALRHGQTGEIGIAGIGLARGYLNRDDLTDEAFIPDFLGIPANPSGRIYRTGDLGRVNVDREIEYKGRVDPRVQVRGYRADLAEIESLLLRAPELPQTVVGISDLVEAPSVPSVPSVPTAPAAPAVPAAPGVPADPTTGIQEELAAVLAEVLGVERVSVDGHFFTDLGADSMVMARFCARARKRAGLPAVSMKDIYRYSTIRSLATAFAPPAPAEAPSATGVAAPAPATFAASAPPSVEVATHAARGGQPRLIPIGKPRYVLCGALQLLFFLGYAYLAAFAMERGYGWISGASGLVNIYLRSVVFGGAGFVAMCTLPIVAKWLLIGRWKPQQIRVWSLAYIRFWVVKTLIRTSPLVRFVGSPLYVLYLRALGAKIGRGVAIFSANMPVATDLLTIGEGTVIRKDSFFSCYRAQAGLIQIGPVTLGRDVFVGEQTVLDIGTSMGDATELGHSSSLHTGQAVPAGEHWHGSPAQRTAVEYRMAGSTARRGLRRFVFPVLQLINLLVVFLPVATGGVTMLFVEVPQLNALIAPGPLAFRSWTFYTGALAASFVLLFGVVLGALLFMVTVPRLLNLFIKPDKVYRLYGFHYWAHRTIARTTNSRFLTRLFGDSSFVVGYLRSLGYRLTPVVQTGSNFANMVKHETPFLVSVGSGTVVASGLSIANAQFSSTSFRVSRASIGPHNFLGNDILYPSGGRTGDNCLLATKVMVPIEGEVREGVGLLGSPSFEIPRSVQRDSQFDHLTHGDALRRGLAAKNRYNLASIGWLLLARLTQLFVFVVLGLGAADLYQSWGALALAAANVLILVFTVLYGALVERAARRFRPLRPTYCSIYDRAFWRQERFFKLAIQIPAVFNGTPFRNVIWRLVGVRIGKRVFDDGASMSEKNLVTIGDGVTLNVGSVVQCHSQEDNAFKSDQITIGANCTIGVAAFVHYGVTMGAGAVLEPDAFLMKGEEVPEGEVWGGNPASKMRNPARVRRDSNDIRGAALVSVQ